MKRAQVFNWIAAVAAALPGAIFDEGEKKRDAKTRVRVQYGTASAEYVIDDETPAQVVEDMREHGVTTPRMRVRALLERHGMKSRLIEDGVLELMEEEYENGRYDGAAN